MTSIINSAVQLPIVFLTRVGLWTQAEIIS